MSGTGRFMTNEEFPSTRPGFNQGAMEITRPSLGGAWRYVWGFVEYAAPMCVAGDILMPEEIGRSETALTVPATSKIEKVRLTILDRHTGSDLECAAYDALESMPSSKSCSISGGNTATFRLSIYEVPKAPSIYLFNSPVPSALLEAERGVRFSCSMGRPDPKSSCRVEIGWSSR